MNLPFLTAGSLFIDNTSLEMFTTCPRQAQFYIVKKREKASNSGAKNFGSAMHLSLEKLRKGFDEPLVKEEILQYFTTNPQDPEEWRTPDLALKTFSLYCKNYPFDNFVILKDPKGTLMVELPFAIPIGSVTMANAATVPIVWTGKIDLLVACEGKTFVWDYKTTSMLGTQFFDEFANSSQMLGYAWAAQHILEKPVAGVIVDALCNRKPSKTGNATQFDRQAIYFTQDRISEWTHNTLAICSDFLSHASRDFFPMHTKWCVAKYGKCQFFDVCTSPIEQREFILGTDLYKNVTWSPLGDSKQPTEGN